MTGKYKRWVERYTESMAGQSEPSRWKKVSWADAQIFLTRLNAQQSAGNPPVGPMCYPPSRNGNMPAVRARPRLTHGGQQLPVRMRIIIGTVVPQMVMTLSRLVMSGSMLPTHGAYLICMEMCGSGPRIGTRRLTLPAIRWWIRPDRRRARIGLSGVVPGPTMGRTTRSAKRSSFTPSHRSKAHGFRVGFQKSQ